MKVSTKFKVDSTIRCLVIALLLLIRYVTLTFDLLTMVSDHTRRVTWSRLPPSLKILWVSVLELSSDISRRISLTMRLQPLRMRHISWPMHRGKFSPHIWNSWSRFACSRYNFFGATIKINRVIRQNSVRGAVLKITQVSAYAQNHASPQHCRKSLPPSFSATTIPH